VKCRREAVLGFKNPYGFRQRLIILLAPQQTATTSGQRCVVYGLRLKCFPLSAANKTCLTNLFWGILATWKKYCSIDLSIQRQSGLVE